MKIKEFFGLTKEKLILFLILFYLPAVVILKGLINGHYSPLHIYLSIGVFIAAYLISCGLCLIRQVNDFLRPTAFKLTILVLFIGLSIAGQVPFFDTTILRFTEGEILRIPRVTLTKGLLAIPSMLLQYYVYTGIIELIVKKIRKVDEIQVDWKFMVKRWWFWAIIAILIIIFATQHLGLSIFSLI